MNMLLGIVTLCIFSFLVMIAVIMTRIEKKVLDCARYVELKVTKLYKE